MKKRFAALVVLSMVLVGAICGYMFYLLFMSTREKLLLHCITTGIVYGLINSVVSLFFIKKYSVIKEDNEKLEHDIRIDRLTGLYNRYALEHDVEMFDENSVYSIIYLDIDNFSNFNNTYGHDAGDIVLKNVAKIIKNSIRTLDRAYRFGGEELVVILDTCTKNAANKIGNKIIENIRGYDNAPYPGITASAGTASFPDDAKSFADMLKAGDMALYKAKELGKDRMVTY